MTQDSPIPLEAQKAAERGDLIGAISIVREQTGLGLKEAKDAVEAHVHGRRATPAAGAEIPLQAILSLQDGNLIEAIRQTREVQGRGLKESKDAVEAYLAAHPPVREQFQSRRRVGGWRRLLLPLTLLVIALLMVYRCTH